MCTRVHYGLLGYVHKGHKDLCGYVPMCPCAQGCTMGCLTMCAKGTKAYVAMCFVHQGALRVAWICSQRAQRPMRLCAYVLCAQGCTEGCLAMCAKGTKTYVAMCFVHKGALRVAPCLCVQRAQRPMWLCACVHKGALEVTPCLCTQRAQECTEAYVPMCTRMHRGLPPAWRF